SASTVIASIVCETSGVLRGALLVAVTTSALTPPATGVPLSSHVVAFAQDGGRVAWIGGSCSQVHVRVLATGRGAVVRRDLGGECQPDYPTLLALGGTRALWTNEWAGLDTYTTVATGAPGDRQRSVAGDYVSDDLGPGAGTRIVAIAGDGPSLVYAVQNVR